MNDTNDSGAKSSLEERFLEIILAFPGRLDAMETRDEQNCRKLARRLAAAAEEERARRG